MGKTIVDLEQKGLRPDLVVIGEASNLDLKIGQRGRTRVFIDIFGKPAHSAHPEKGINAVYMASGVVILLTENNKQLMKLIDKRLKDMTSEMEKRDREIA